MKLNLFVSFLVSSTTYISLVSADIKFAYPAGGETIDLTQVKLINIEWCESGISPNITQLENYIIRLYSGSNENPVLLPVKVVNEDGPVPGSPGNATYPKTALSQVSLSNLDGLETLTPNAYFFGVTSQFRASPNTTILDFSQRFSLAGFSGSTSPSFTLNANNTDTTPPNRIFFCSGVPCIPSADLVTLPNGTNNGSTTPQHSAEDPSEQKKRTVTVFIIAYVGAAVGIVLLIVGVIWGMRGRRKEVGGYGGGVGGKGVRRGMLRFTGRGVGGNGNGNGNETREASRWSGLSGKSSDGWNGMG